MDELIICVAPYPGEKQDEKFPGVMDVTDEVIRSYEAGAAIAHLHVRDQNGLQVTDTTWFQRDLAKIRSACPIIIEGSTGGVPEHTLAERCVSFSVPGVELGTLNLGSINMYDGVYDNPMGDMRFYAAELKKRKIKPLLIIFDLSHFSYVESLTQEGLIVSPYNLSLVFDVPNALPYQERYLDFFLQEMPENKVWFLARHHAQGAQSFGKALERGGHIRVGYEDGPFLSDGRRATSNAELVEDIVKAAEAIGRKVVDPDRAREILDVK